MLALCAGAINVFSFAPFGLWPLQIASVAFVFLLALRASSAGNAALIGWAYGFAWTGTGVHWLYISMHRYGGLPSWMAALAVALMAVTLGAFAALAIGGGSKLARRWNASNSVTLLLIFPAAWALAEWSRGWVLTGFPWVSSGYAHNVGPLSGFAPVIGVYGLAWVSALIAGCLTLLPSKRVLPIALSLLLLGSGLLLKNVQWTSPHGELVSVRLLQGNIPQEMKFQPQQIAHTLDLYRNMIAEASADLIATPETAIPLLSTQLPPDYLRQLTEIARSSNSHITLGIPVSDGPRQYANSIIGLSPSDAAHYRYDKHHLVPFGEFIPFGARWFVNMMQIPLGDFTRGALLQRPFSVRDQWVLPNICYEDLFGEEIAAQLAAGDDSGIPQATILLNASNIAWFGDSIAVPQHLQISQMRALETGRPMLRATNTGATAVIGPDGRVLDQLPAFERGSLAASVQGYSGLTPYSRFRNAPVILLSFALIGIAWLLSRSNPHSAIKTR
jgi:apolipoprotein N-acyltransferase